MQNGHNAGKAAEIAWIGSQLDDRMSRGPEEDAVNPLLMQARKSSELMR